MLKSPIFVIFLFCILSAGCGKKEKVYINGFILRDVAPLYVNYYREVYVHNKNGFPIVPICQINDTSLTIADYHYDYYLFSDNKRFDINKKYELNLQHRGGKAQGEVFMPGEFSILQPDTSYILKKDSVLKIFWSKANGATWYWLDIYIDYWYEDTLGEEEEYESQPDTIIYDTFVIYEKNRFFPPYVDSITEGETGIINVWACNGPTFLPGSQGNIFGAGYGILMTANQPGEREFNCGIHAKNKKPNEHTNKKLTSLTNQMRTDPFTTSSVHFLR